MHILKKLKQLIDISSYIALLNYSSNFNWRLITLTIVNSILSVATVYMAFISKEIIDTALAEGFVQSFPYVIAYISLFVTELIIASIVTRKSALLRIDVKHQIQQHFFDAVMKKKWRDINDMYSGDLSTRIFDDIQRIVDIITGSIPSVIALTFQMISGFIFLFIYDPFLAIVTFTLTPIALLISMYIGMKLRRIQGRIQDNEAAQWTLISETVSNFTIIKAFGVSGRILNRLRSLHSHRREFVSARNMVKIKANIVMEIGYFLSFFIILLIGTRQLSLGIITFGTLAAFLQVIDNIQMPIEEIATELPSIVSSFSSLDRLKYIEALVDEPDAVSGADLSFQTLTVENMCFRYDTALPLHENLDMQISKGERIAIIGKSGQGKTTLINLFLNYLEPDSGEIYFTDKQGQVIPSSDTHRQLFSYVPQRNMIFAGTIRENLFLSEDQSDIELALTTACCDDFIEKMEDGLDTELMEGGYGLSQGQIQRLCIARALLHKRPILLLDEATSDLDQMTERNVIDNLNANYPDLTIISITHRNNMSDLCSKVYTLDNGHLYD